MMQTIVVPQGCTQGIPMYYILYRKKYKSKFLQLFIPWNKVPEYIGCYDEPEWQEMLFSDFDSACNVAKDFQKHPDKLKDHIKYQNKQWSEHYKRFNDQRDLAFVSKKFN